MEAAFSLPSIFTSVKVLQKGGKNRRSLSLRSPLISKSFSVSSTAIINSAFLLIFVTILTLPHNRYFSAQAFNDEKGILKWNPYWFSNFRYQAPTSFYISPNRVGTPYKRVSESAGISGGYSGAGSTYGSGGSIYKWSPVYFSGSSSSSPGLQQPSSFYNYGSGTTGLGGGGYMYSPSRPRWSLSDYGGSRFLTRYYGGNSFIPSAVPRSISGVDGGVGLGGEASVIDLAGSNDLSALLGDELMNNGLGLENDRIDVLDGENPEAVAKQGQHQQQRSH